MSLDLAGTLLDPVKSYVCDAIKDYVSYIINYNENMNTFKQTLDDLCSKKHGIDGKVNRGLNNNDKITREAARWLERVHELIKDEELKKLMTKDTEITKIVFQVMVGEQKVMKKLVREDREMQLIVEKAMRVLEGEAVEGINQVMVQVVNDITMEFKKLIKEDEKMALAATKLLPDEDLEKLKRDNSEMAVAIEKGRDSNYTNFLENYRGEGDKQVGNVKEHLDEDSIKVAASDLLKPLERLIKIDKFKRVLPEALSIVVDVMEKISASLSKLEIVDEKKLEKQRYRDCCSAVFISYYHSRYLLSKAAKSMAERIQGHMISNCPVQVTEPKSLQELKTIPSRSISLKSREELALEIVRNLKDHEVNVVGVHGMGGSGKTILVKEVANNRAIKQSFKSIVYVEISEAPNIKHIQDHIAQQLEMSLPYEHSLSQRARMLYNRLTSEKKQESKDGIDKGKDVLIIMDNIWKKLDLEELGIPDQNTKESRCKLLLTSREADVCKAMGVREAIHEVGVLSENEAWDLFWKQLDKCVDLDHEYKSMAEKLLKKCGCLPLAIVGTANALKGKELSAWEHFANELEKPISSQDADIHREAYSILQTSYKLMENNLKKRFFLLSCLFPPGSSIRVSDMMRYGIGLGLFQNVNNLTQAMELADEWAKQLVSSSLLLEDDEDGCVKIHDVVRASIIQFAPKEGHEIMVEAIPRWLWEETCRKYTAISLISGRDHSRLNMVMLENLEILVLNHTQPCIFPEDFFQGMTNLRVLSMSGMNFEHSLPLSIRELKTLRALFIEHCTLGETGLIGNLKNLLVLSFRGSDVRELSEEIRHLDSLYLLDLTNCTKLERIPPSVMARLSQLEGLYIKNSFTKWANVVSQSSGHGDDGTKSSEGASVAELGPLNSLKVLEMKLESIRQLPTRDLAFVDSLDNFDIQIGSFELPALSTDMIYRRLLNLGSFNLDQLVEYNCLNVLLKKADCLQLVDGEGLKHLVPNFDLEKDGFRDLKLLQVKGCANMKYIIGNTYGGMSSLIWFPKLVSMLLSNLSALQTIYERCEALPEGLSQMTKLQRLVVEELPAVDFYLLPIHIAPNLTYLSVRKCDKLKFVFIEHATDQSVNYCYRNERKDASPSFPHLKVVKLESVLNLESLFGEECSTSMDRQPLFPNKIEFPALEELNLNEVGVIKLWKETYNDPQEELYISRFRKLKVIDIDKCHKLESLCTPSIAEALVELESLLIRNCSNMRQVISNESNLMHNPDNHKPVVLPNLKHLELRSLPMVTCFYGGSSQATFFDEKIRFSSLETLVLVGIGMEKLWDWPDEEETEAKINLRNKELYYSSFQKLKEIEVGDCDKLECLFSPCDVAALKQLESLTVENCSQMLDVITNNVADAVDIPDHQVIVFSNLKRLGLNYLPRVRNFHGGNSTSFFNEKIRLPLLEEFRLRFATLNVEKIWDDMDSESTTGLRNPAPSLKLLVIGGTRKVRKLKVQVPYTVLQNLLSLELNQLDIEVLMQSSSSSSSNSSSSSSSSGGGGLKAATSSKPLQECMHEFESLKELTVRRVHWKYIFWVSGRHDGRRVILMPLLETLRIYRCKLESIVGVGDGDNHGEVDDRRQTASSIVFPRLRIIRLMDLSKARHFSQITSSFEFPSLKRLTIYWSTDMRSFLPTGRVIAPALRDIDLFGNPDLEWVFPCDEPEYVQKLPSLSYLDVDKCPKFRALSRGPLSFSSHVHVHISGVTNTAGHGLF